MLAKLWIIGDLFLQFVEMYIGSDTMETSMEVPQKIKYSFNISKKSHF